MAAELSEQARRLVDGRNFAHLATLFESGQPKVEPVWIDREDDRLLIATDARSIKADNLRKDPRVALSITELTNPYVQLLVRGVVVDERPDEDLAGLDRMSQKYLGRPFPRRNWSERLIFVIEPNIARYYESSLEMPAEH